MRHRAGGRRQQPGGDPQQRRLAAARRSDDRHELAGRTPKDTSSRARVPSGNVISMWSKVTPDVWVSGGEPRGMQFLSVACPIVASFAAGSSGRREAERSASSRAPSGARSYGRAFRHLLRAVRAPAVRRGGRAPVYENALEQAVRRRRAGVRLGVGRRAPLPRGLQPLLGAGGVPDRRGGPDIADPRRPRRRGVRAGDEPPGAGGRAGGGARHPVRRAARRRHGAVVDVDGARRVRRRPGPHQADVGRVRPRPSADVVGRAVRLGRASGGGCPNGGSCRRRSSARTRRCGSP